MFMRKKLETWALDLMPWDQILSLMNVSLLFCPSKFHFTHLENEDDNNSTYLIGSMNNAYKAFNLMTGTRVSIEKVSFLLPKEGSRV